MVAECDNKKELHDMLIPCDNAHGLHAYCKRCLRHYYLRKDSNGNPQKRMYAKLFLRDFIQPSKPLYYKVHPDRMTISP